MGYHRGRVWPWSLAWLVFIAWVISYANKWEDYCNYFWDLNPCGWDRGWDGWMALPTRWTWVWASFGSWWWTGKPGMLQSMGSKRVGHDWATELNWFWGRGGYFQDLGHHPLPVLNNPWELSWHLWVCHSLADQGSRSTLPSWSHSWFILCPWAMSFFQKLCPTPFPPFTRILDWVAISFSRGSSWTRDRTQVSCIAGWFFPVWATKGFPEGNYHRSKSGWWPNSWKSLPLLWNSWNNPPFISLWNYPAHKN